MDILNKHTHGCPSDSTYIGRGSPFGNLLVIGKDGTREEVIAWYRHWLRNKLLEKDPVVEKAFKALTKDSKLLCFCSPKPCHGEVIKEYWEFFQSFPDYETALGAFKFDYRKQDALLYSEYKNWIIDKLITRDPVFLNDFRDKKEITDNVLPFKYKVIPYTVAMLIDVRNQLLSGGDFDKALIKLASDYGAMPYYQPYTDGIDHINIYSKAKTKLGRALSNFSEIGFLHPKYGKFVSMEGYWYWLATGKTENRLRNLSGYAAKELGRKLPRVECDGFEADVKKGLLLRVEQNPVLAEAMKKCTLPFSHYYSYGNDLNPKIIADDKNKWIVDYIELIREYLNGKAHKVIIAGSRDVTDLDWVRSGFNCSNIKAIEIVSGKAKGVDTLGEEIAKSLKLPIAEFPADWDQKKL
jgi:hypothetical protein